jgi:hypothetical protein
MHRDCLLSVPPRWLKFTRLKFSSLFLLDKSRQKNVAPPFYDLTPSPPYWYSQPWRSSRDSSASTVGKLRAGRAGFDSGQGKIFISLTVSKQVLRPTQLPIQSVILPWGRELTAHLNLVPRLRMRGAILHTPSVFMAWCLIKHIGYFTFCHSHSTNASKCMHSSAPWANDIPPRQRCLGLSAWGRCLQYIYIIFILFVTPPFTFCATTQLISSHPPFPTSWLGEYDVVAVVVVRLEYTEKNKIKTCSSWLRGILFLLQCWLVMEVTWLVYNSSSI